MQNTLKCMFYMNIKVLRRVVIAKIVEASKNVYKNIMLVS